MSYPVDRVPQAGRMVRPLVASGADQPDWTAELVENAPDGYVEMVDDMRVLLDRVAAAHPPPSLVDEVTEVLGRLNAQLLRHEVPESGQLAGRLAGVPGRGQLLTPPYAVDELDGERLTGRVLFGRHYLGSNGAVHGGAIPLLFDDLLGALALVGDRPRSRTAFLHVAYRSIAPIEKELQIEGRFERTEGRKLFMRGVLRDGGRICAEAEGLFVALRPGQR